MSIASDVTRIESAKAAIKAAIEGKGVTVPEATLLDGMASLIESIEAGGGGSGGGDAGDDAKMFTGTFTLSEDTSPSEAYIPIYLKDTNSTPTQFLFLLFSDITESKSRTQYIESLIRYVQYVDGVSRYNQFVYGYNKGTQKTFSPYFTTYTDSTFYANGMIVDQAGFNGKIAAGITYRWYVWGDNLKQ